MIPEVECIFGMFVSIHQPQNGSFVHGYPGLTNPNISDRITTDLQRDKSTEGVSIRAVVRISFPVSRRPRLEHLRATFEGFIRYPGRDAERLLIPGEQLLVQAAVPVCLADLPSPITDNQESIKESLKVVEFPVIIPLDIADISGLPPSISLSPDGPFINHGQITQKSATNKLCYESGVFYVLRVDARFEGIYEHTEMSDEALVLFPNFKESALLNIVKSELLDHKKVMRREGKWESAPSHVGKWSFEIDSHDESSAVCGCLGDRKVFRFRVNEREDSMDSVASDKTLTGGQSNDRLGSLSQQEVLRNLNYESQGPDSEATPSLVSKSSTITEEHNHRIIYAEPEEEEDTPPPPPRIIFSEPEEEENTPPPPPRIIFEEPEEEENTPPQPPLILLEVPEEEPIQLNSLNTLPQPFIVSPLCTRPPTQKNIIVFPPRDPASIQQFPVLPPLDPTTNIVNQLIQDLKNVSMGTEPIICSGGVKRPLEGWASISVVLIESWKWDTESWKREGEREIVLFEVSETVEVTLPETLIPSIKIKQSPVVQHRLVVNFCWNSPSGEVEKTTEVIDIKIAPFTRKQLDNLLTCPHIPQSVLEILPDGFLERKEREKVRREGLDSLRERSVFESQMDGLGSARSSIKKLRFCMDGPTVAPPVVVMNVATPSFGLLRHTGPAELNARKNGEDGVEKELETLMLRANTLQVPLKGDNGRSRESSVSSTSSKISNWVRSFAKK
ncbi:hypothetical protein HDU79_010762 [Rhizoclosmatium sp. JEL0117]|nr:hypothetical protein HDU79_010762 [Rhizoclosmatium sp. JEL0117]